MGASGRVLLCGIILAMTPIGRTHEMGAMKVKALFSANGRYQIDVVVDAEHLPAGENPLAGRPGSSLASEADTAILLDAFRERFQQEMRIAFDGKESAVQEVPISDPEAAPQKILFRFAGDVPAGASAFTWSHGSAFGSYLFGARNDGDPHVSWQWLEGGKASAPFALRHAPKLLTRPEVVRLYLGLGFTHILPHGLDHILFVLGLFFLSLRPRTILAQVTAFTLAHSITLALSLYGVVSLSPRIVEPLIALSIVYVTVENLVVTEVKAWRVAIVFCFGLLHGMGFAGVLRELGLPRSEFLTALASFNVGVEAGQLAVISLAFLAVGIWFGRKPWYRAYITVPASALIALVGLYWTVQRVFL